MKVFAGNSNRRLAESICNYLNVPLGKASVRRFADQEIFVEIQENVRGEDVFILQSTSYPANDHLMELLIMIDAFRRSSAAASPPCFPISAMPARTAAHPAARRSRPSWSPT
jgi:ribose-phosphate pyrophosphokinase